MQQGFWSLIQFGIIALDFHDNVYIRRGRKHPDESRRYPKPIRDDVCGAINREKLHQGLVDVDNSGSWEELKREKWRKDG